MRCQLLAVALVLPMATWSAQPVSGYEFLDETTRAMQDDDFDNPGLVAVDRGSELFHERREAEPNACASCHGKDGVELSGPDIARYPVYDANLGGLVTLQRRINYCWEINLDRFPLTPGHSDLIALETFVRNRAKGEPVNVQTDGEMSPLIVRGEALYNTRFGQLNLACQHCHVQHQGQMLRGQKLSQGHSNGFPEYRLGKGRITSFQQRLAECFVSFRAEPFEPGAEEADLIELYVNVRGNGLPIETPAVRF
ncbi:MAG: sulfur oxidation c-type cytochrome SoxA [Gammaproteobacteria bacterium]|nr:sulfur oxidation c-type cytochrome SoxA [Gammaproteobacteria bacterium]MCP5299309.1 sulfur oxidation c-type cytochrome SoxA [Chromatiaceae bacterium]